MRRLMTVNTHGELIVHSRLYALNPDLRFDEELRHWVNKRGDYDDEANDDRPDDEKYKNYWSVQILLLIVLVGLIFLVRYILNNIG